MYHVPAQRCSAFSPLTVQQIFVKRNYWAEKYSLRFHIRKLCLRPESGYVSAWRLRQRLLTCVGSPVDVQRWLLYEALPAKVADEWPLLSMYAHVDIQMLTQ